MATPIPVASIAEKIVTWIDVALLVAGIAFCALLAVRFIFPLPHDQHGGAFELLGFLILVPSLGGVLVAWLGMRRRERWRWWAQLLPFVIFCVTEALLDGGFYDSAWQIPIFLGVPCATAVAYALFRKSRAG